MRSSGLTTNRTMTALTAPTQKTLLGFVLVGSVLVVCIVQRPLAPLLGGSQPKGVAPSTSLVQVHRDAYSKLCTTSKSTAHDVDSTLVEWFQPPLTESASGTTVLQESTPATCNFTFLDFGANNGDSMGKFIDAGIGSCHKFPGARYNIENGHVARLDPIANNYVTPWSRERMLARSQQVGRMLNPEDYCYYGVEGNPVFTKRLKMMEHVALQTKPPPLLSAHFYTETVVVDKDGPTQLFLETEGNHHWGSSIYATHKTVKKSAKHTEDHKPTAADVTGITLTTIVRATTRKEAGNHLLLKIDIEGAEFVVLDEAYKSGILCEYVKSSVQVDLLIEIHKPRKIGAGHEGFQRWERVIRPALLKCGVAIQKMVK